MQKVFIAQLPIILLMEEEMPGDFPGDEAMPKESAGQKSKIDKRVIAGIAIIAIAAAALLLSMDAIVLSANQLGLVNITGIFGEEPMQMLIIGQPSAGLLADLDNQQGLVYYRVKNAADLDSSPSAQLEQYDVILLDQHLGATPYEKSVSRALGEAIENYVMAGGKLVVVMDSGIYRSGGELGTGVASDVIGWEETFGEIIPVECDEGIGGTPTCRQPTMVTGRIERLDPESRIMQGIETAPADPAYGPMQILAFDVKPAGEQVAYIDSTTGTQNYPAIVEKKLIAGKSIYFNYDPAMTPGIWQNTLEYLR